MKINYHDFIRSVKTTSEKSSVVNELYIARSAVGLNAGNHIMPLFGFAADPDQYKAEWKSQHELLEHMIFLPYAHDEVSFNKEPVYCTENLTSSSKASIKSFLIGEAHAKGIFNANGCAISSNMQMAIDHAENELLERHLFCHLWYHRSLPLLPVNYFNLELIQKTVTLEFYTTREYRHKKFAAVSLSCEESGFFAFGGAVRDCLKTALLHAAGEAVMLFEDAYKGRSGRILHDTQGPILSLRDSNMSEKRKAWLLDLINLPPSREDDIKLNFKTICFEPLPRIFAARSFASDALDPKQFFNVADIPILPLF